MCGTNAFFYVGDFIESHVPNEKINNPRGFDDKIDDVMRKHRVDDTRKDHEFLKQYAKKNEKEHQKFYTFLKTTDLPSEEIDEIVQTLIDEISDDTNCADCGNCCKHLNTTITEKDVKSIAECMSTSESEVIEEYLKKNKFGEYVWKSLPCPFLHVSYCQLGPYKPDACKEYPHLNNPGFVNRLRAVMENLKVCPMVAELFEELKVQLHFK